MYSGSTLFYGIITGVTYYVLSGVTILDIDGPPCNSVLTETTSAGIGQPFMLHLETFAINGAYGDHYDTTLLASDTNTYWKWYTNRAYLVRFSVIHKSDADGTNPKINIRINNNDVSDSNSYSGITVTTNWSSTKNNIDSTNYIVNFEDNIEIKTSADTGGTHASNLTVQTTFVMVPTTCSYSPPM